MATRVLMGNCALEAAVDLKLFVGNSLVFEDVMRREQGEKISVGNSCIKKDSSSDDSSSIGRNSDISANSLEKPADSEEVQSPYKGPLDAMETLEEVLPIRFRGCTVTKILQTMQCLCDNTGLVRQVGRSHGDTEAPDSLQRGISRFYNGKSKSFATLSDLSSSSSIKEVAKPDNAYTRRRRNMLASGIISDKVRGDKGFSTLRGNGGGISKKLAGSGSGRTTLALAVAMKNSESDEQRGVCDSSAGVPSMSSSRNEFSSLRSYSFADLQHCI